MNSGRSSVRMRTSDEDRPNAKRGIRFTVRHLEAHHRRVVFLLKRFDLGAGLDDDDAERTGKPARGRAKIAVDDAIRLF